MENVTRIRIVPGILAVLVLVILILRNKKKAPRVAAGPEAPPFARSMGENLGRMARSILPLTLILGTLFGISFLLWLPLQLPPLVLSAIGRSTVPQLPEASQLNSVVPWPLL